MFHFLPRSPFLWTLGSTSENKGIGIAHSHTFECTMRNYIAQRRDRVASADKRSKTMDVWGDLYQHLMILVDIKVKVNESVKCC